MKNNKKAQKLQEENEQAQSEQVQKEQTLSSQVQDSRLEDTEAQALPEELKQREPESVLQATEDELKEQYKLLEEKLAMLEAQSEKLQAEVGKLRDRKGTLKRQMLYRELLKSPVLGGLTEVYLEWGGKEDQYEEVRGYLEVHAEDKAKIRAELTADMERYKGENLTNLAVASGIMSIAGLVYAAMGAGTGLLIVLFVVLGIVSAGVLIKSSKSTECSRMLVYVLAVLQDMENHVK